MIYVCVFKRMSSWSWCYKSPLGKQVDHRLSQLSQSSLGVLDRPWSLRAPWRLFWGSWVRCILSFRHRRAWKLSKSFIPIKYIDVLSAILVADSCSHEVQKFFEIDLTWSVSIQVSDHLVDRLVLGLKAQWGHGSLQFLGVDSTATFLSTIFKPVSVKQVERLFDLKDLVFGKSRALELLRVETLLSTFLRLLLSRSLAH